MYFDPTLTQAQRRGKLRELAKFMSVLNPRNLDMGMWCADNATEESCGWAGCVAGWAATLFHKEGYILHRFTDNMTLPVLRMKERMQFSPLDAFALFFGLPTAFSYAIIAGTQTEAYSDWDGNRLPYTAAPIARTIPSYFTEFDLNRRADITPPIVVQRINNRLAELEKLGL